MVAAEQRCGAGSQIPLLWFMRNSKLPGGEEQTPVLGSTSTQEASSVLLSVWPVDRSALGETHRVHEDADGPKQELQVGSQGVQVEL